MKPLVLFVVTLFAVSVSSARVASKLKIRGRLKAVHKDVVELELKTGKPNKMKIVKVKKADVPDLHGYIVGEAEITVQTSIHDFAVLNHEYWGPR